MTSPERSRLVQRVARTSQPPSSSRVNWSSPLARGLLHLFDFGKGRDSNLLYPGTATVNTGVVIQKPEGFYVSSGGGLPAASYPVKQAAFTALTWFCLVKFHETSSAFVLGKTSGPGTGYDHGLYISAGGYPVIFVHDGTSGYSIAGTSTVAGSGIGLMVGTFDTVTGQQRIYWKGKLENSTTLAPFPLRDVESTINLCGWNNTIGHGGTAYMGGVYAARILSPVEVRELSDNPWQLFAPAQRTVPPPQYRPPVRRLIKSPKPACPPHFNPKVNQHHPLAKNLVALFSAADLNFLADGTPIEQMGGPAYYDRRISAVGGPGFATTNYDAAIGLLLPNTSRMKLEQTPASIIVALTASATPYPGYSHLWSVRTEAAGASALFYIDGSGFICLQVRGQDLVGEPVANSAFGVYGAEWGSAQGQKMFKNGRLSATNDANTLAVELGAIARPCIGNKADGGRGLQYGQIHTVALFNINIGNQWQAELARNPWQLFAPQPRAYWPEVIAPTVPVRPVRNRSVIRSSQPQSATPVRPEFNFDLAWCAAGMRGTLVGPRVTSDFSVRKVLGQRVGATSDYSILAGVPPSLYTPTWTEVGSVYFAAVSDLVTVSARYAGQAVVFKAGSPTDLVMWTIADVLIGSALPAGLYNYVARRNGSAHDLWLNGVHIGTVSNGSSAVGPDGTQAAIGCQAGSGPAVGLAPITDGNALFMVARTATPLPTTVCQQLSANPWQVFIPQPRQGWLTEPAPFAVPMLSGPTAIDITNTTAQPRVDVKY